MVSIREPPRIIQFWSLQRRKHHKERKNRQEIRGWGVSGCPRPAGGGGLETQNYRTDLVNKCLLGSYREPGTILGTAEKQKSGVVCVGGTGGTLRELRF